MMDVSQFLPHEAPAIMLQAFEPWAEGDQEGLKGYVRLNECSLLWMTDKGLPIAFSIEILGQLSGVFLRRSDGGDQLLGGRLAALDSFVPLVNFLPGEILLEARVSHLDGSSIGYHKFVGDIRSESGEVLAEAAFSVIAFSKE